MAMVWLAMASSHVQEGNSNNSRNNYDTLLPATPNPTLPYPLPPLERIF